MKVFCVIIICTVLIFSVVSYPSYKRFRTDLIKSSHFINTKLYDAKFDPKYFIPVSVLKPLGITLAEMQANEEKGVYVDQINEGSIKNSGAVKRGLYLLEINGNDVKYASFDSIMDLLIDAPADKPIDLVFIDQKAVFQGPAELKIVTMDRKQILLKTYKSQNLRSFLLGNGIELYNGSAKIRNCAGGGNCGTCVVSITKSDGWEERPKFESLRLKKYDNTARLSCNTIIEGDCTIVINPDKIN